MSNTASGPLAFSDLDDFESFRFKSQPWIKLPHVRGNSYVAGTGKVEVEGNAISTNSEGQVMLEIFDAETIVWPAGRVYLQRGVA